MEIVIEFLKEFGVYLLTSAGVVLSIILGRPKTAEKLEKKKQKQKQKLLKKANKLYNKWFGIYKLLYPLFVDDNGKELKVDEIVDYHEGWAYIDEVRKNG